MDLKRLNIFAAVAATGNMTHAADRLGISQPTVSQTVAELERHYRTRLFERYPKRLCLTDAGKHLLTHAQVIIDSFNDIEKTMRGNAARGRLRVGASGTVGISVMSHLIAALKRQGGDSELYVRVENTSGIEQALLDNQLDVAIVEGEVTHPFLFTEPVINDCLIVVCGRGHRLADRPRVPVRELADEVFILREKGSGTRALFESVMREKGLAYRIGWEADSIESIKQAVIRNHGLAVLSGRLVAKELASGDIRLLPVVDCMWKRQFLLAWHRDKIVSDAMEAFMALARTYEKYGLSCPMSQSELMRAIDTIHLVE